MPTLQLDPASGLFVNQFGEVFDPSGRMRGGAQLGGQGPAPSAPGLGGNATPASQMDFLKPPPSRQFLDASRAGWSPKGYKTADEALAASLSEGRRTGEPGGFAIEGPGGQFFTSNADRDRARAVSANPLDQFEAFKLLAPKLGIYGGPNGAFGPEGMRAFAGFSGMANQSKESEAKLEEQLAKQYALTTRGSQEDAREYNKELIQAKGRAEAEKIRGEAELNKARVVGRATIGGAFAGPIAELAKEKKPETADALAKLVGRLQGDFENERSGTKGLPTGTAASGPASGFVAPGFAPKGLDPIQAFSDSARMDALKSAFGFAPVTSDKATGKDKYNPFSAETALQEALKQPDLVRNPEFRRMLQTAGGSVSPLDVKTAIRDRMLQSLTPSSLNVFGGIPAEQEVAGLTVRHTQPAVSGGGRSNRRAVPGSFQISGPGGQALDTVNYADLPFGRFSSGASNLLPRPFTSSRQLQAERQAIGELYKAVHGID